MVTWRAKFVMDKNTVVFSYQETASQDLNNYAESLGVHQISDEMVI